MKTTILLLALLLFSGCTSSYVDFKRDCRQECMEREIPRGNWGGWENEYKEIENKCQKECLEKFTGEYEKVQAVYVQKVVRNVRLDDWTRVSCYRDEDRVNSTFWIDVSEENNIKKYQNEYTITEIIYPDIDFKFYTETYNYDICRISGEIEMDIVTGNQSYLYTCEFHVTGCSNVCSYDVQTQINKCMEELI